MEFKYKYTEIKGTESQYSNVVFEIGVPVEAVYIKSKVDIDQGNPFIEALPMPRIENEVTLAYERGLPNYKLDEAIKFSKLDKMLQLETLKNLRFALPFHKELEIKFYNALLVSYRMREFVFSKKEGVQCNAENDNDMLKGRLLGNAADSANAGFSLIGYSGCGKSTALHILLSRYPQVIVHKVGDGYFTQIVYLTVNCIANSNFSALYEGIGEAIDKALGNYQPIYAAEIAKTSNLGKKAEKIKEFIDKFGIGAIIFDEIQLIDFNSTKENSFDSLLTLVNRTKMALIVVGTEDAKSKMFKELRTARRVGSVISADLYCNSRIFFSILVKALFKYQWFNEPVRVTEEVTDALYDTTKGIIDQLINIYIVMHYEALNKQLPASKIDVSFIYKVAKKYYPEMQIILNTLKNTKADNCRKNVNLELKEAILNATDKEIQKSEINSMIQKFEENEYEEATLKNVIKIINNLYDYPEKEIKKQYMKIASKKNARNLNEKEVSRAIIKEMEEKPKKKTNKKSNIRSKISIEEMQTFLNI